MPEFAKELSSSSSSTSSSSSSSDGVTVVLDRKGASLDLSHYLALWLWLGWGTFYILFFATLPITCSFLRLPWTLLLLIILVSATTSVERKYQPAFTFHIGQWILTKAADYFQLRVSIYSPKELESAGPSIFVLEPHGVLPMGIFAFSDVLGAVKGHRGIGCISSACFLVPMMRHVFTWAFAESVSKENVTRLIDEKYSVAICPGGVQETFLLNESGCECTLFLRQRLGFIKLALQHGTPLIPTFVRPY